MWNRRGGFRIGLLTAALAWSLSAAAEKTASFEVDTDASRVFIKVGKATRLGHEHGVQGNLKSGKLTLGGEGELVFDMASFTADTVEARKRVGLASTEVPDKDKKEVTKTMLGKDVLDVDKYPTATFRITTIKPLDKQTAGEPGMYELTGEFTLHGKEQKLTFKAKAEKGDKDGRLKLKGRFTIKQTDFGIKPISAAGGFVKVADELEVFGDLVLKARSGK
jgi:polyisoprenoid-binding protein YceI